MTTGYTRQSAGQIVDGNTATAAMFNNEFNKIQEAFNITEGHNHDGTVGGGAKLTPSSLIGVSGNGAIFRTGDNTFASRPIQGSPNQIKVQQGDGVNGSPVISLEDALTLTGKTLTGGTYTGGTIQAGMTIQKSPVLTFTGDLAGSGIVTNLGDSNLSGGLRGVTGNATGMIARTGDGAFAVRTITPPTAGIAIDNGNGISGNPTLRLVNDLAAVEGLESLGIACRTGDGAWVTRTIQGTGNQITVNNAGGAAGNPTLSFPTDLRFPGSIRVSSGADITGNSVVRGDLTVVGGNFATRGMVDTAVFRQLTVTNAGVGIAQANPTSAVHIGSATLQGDASITMHCGNGSANRNWRMGVRYGGANTNGATTYGFFIQDTQAAQDRLWINYQTGVTSLNGGAFIGRQGSGNVLTINNGFNSGDDGCQVQYNGGVYNAFTRVLQTNGAFQIVNTSYAGIVAEFRQNGSAYNPTGTWGSLSDLRKKEHVETARGYLEDLNKLRVVKYALKADQLDHADKLGVVAQEVAEVFPGLVDEGRGIDGPELTVKSSVFTFMLIKAVQELTARVNHLESQLVLG